MSNQSFGKLIVITGKTASGKDTTKDALLEKFPHLKKVVTTTSRPPRDGETNGVDYHFVTRAEFEKKIESGEFAEYVEYGGNLYGTYRAELKQALSQNTLWRIDPSRAGGLRDFLKRSFPPDIANELIKRILVIYITVSDEVVLERLRERNLPSQEIAKRMADDKKIWEQYKDNYDYIIENVPGKLDEIVDKIINILQAHVLQ